MTKERSYGWILGRGRPEFKGHGHNQALGGEGAWYPLLWNREWDTFLARS